MAVKDLVNLYESAAPTPSSPTREIDGLPPRFSRHPLLSSGAPRSVSPPSRPGPRSIFLAREHDSSPNIFTTADETRTPEPETSNEGIISTVNSSTVYSPPRRSSLASPPVTPENPFEDAAEAIPLVSVHKFELRSREPYTYPLSPTQTIEDTPIISDDSRQFQSIVSTSTLVPSSLVRQSHTPVPLTTVLARNAPPLHLPLLDDHISRLPKPSFPKWPHVDGEGKHKEEAQMFPPLDLLAASGKSLDDLENNAQVTPGWRSETGILSMLVNLIVGATSSSALVMFYSVQGFFNTLQIFALILSTMTFTGDDLELKWKNLLLGTIPNILALNFGSTQTESIVVLMVFMVVTFILLIYFLRSTTLCQQYKRLEGLQKPQQQGGLIVFVTFILTVIYLPLSTMAVHAVVWSSDLWAVPNYYENATSYPPVVPPLGPLDEFRDPLDFCYTTTMKRNEINWSPVVVIVSILVIALFTVYFPIRLRQVIQEAAPRVGRYTELGKLRSKSDRDREYQRLLERDNNPFSFLYIGFRRDWAAFESNYLFAKLSSLLVVAVVNPNNCLFRTFDRATLSTVQQSLLLVATIGFFLQQCFLQPFLDPVSNASEWTSRLNYVITSLIALLVTLKVPGYGILNGALLYLTYIITYGLGAWFTVVQWGFMLRFVKSITKRVDFSIDIFSPRLDISSSSPHARRRIWQEAISALLLTSAECKIPKKQQMEFAQAPDSEYPPYLLQFMDSPGERHVENLKILRDIGLNAYSKAVSLMHGPDAAWFRRLVEDIQEHYVGPDCYWKDPESAPPKPGFTRYFGNAWWIPFPPTLVIRYDDGPLAVLKEVNQLDMYCRQNANHDVQRRKSIRMALRALDGQIVAWPYDHIQSVGGRYPWFGGRRYSAVKTTKFERCVLALRHRGHLYWEHMQLGSGFDVRLTYAKGVHVAGDILGLTDHYELTPQLARFLSLNESAIASRLHQLEASLDRYRDAQRKECQAKARVMSYRFLSFVYNCPREPIGLAESSIEYERDLRLRQLMVGSEDVFEISWQRLAFVSNCELSTWWYLFWDDLWRRNYDTISALRTHAMDFNPHYRTSIAYSPLPRAALETFLTQRGLSASHGWFTSGFLNKIYLRMNDIAFHGLSAALILHLGDNDSELDMSEVDQETLRAPSTLGTGGGTDHDDDAVRARPKYRWEGILSDTPHHHHRLSIWTKLASWFGISPLYRTGTPSAGLSLDVRLENGRYVLLRSGGEGESGESKYSTTASKFI